jgi:hypothetical protein
VTIPCKSLEPTHGILFERVPFEESSVKRVCVVNELLEVFQGDFGGGRGTSQVLDKGIKAVGPQSKNDVVFLGYVFQRRGNARWK